MRLLVTNRHAPRAHAIIRALRSDGTRVVATIEGDGTALGINQPLLRWTQFSTCVLGASAQVFC